MADAGNVAWDMGSYQWLLQAKDFPSIHASLQRQSVLNMAYGLYEVLPGKIYQVRGFDLANISFIKGDTGWIVFDPLTARKPRARHSRSSTRSSASVRLWASSTPTLTSTTSAACGAWWTRPTCGAARSW
jgi:alkyl sulfatase BDS1-like metallo-beta-lactamase superfamily hydrolase